MTTIEKIKYLLEYVDQLSMWKHEQGWTVRVVSMYVGKTHINNFQGATLEDAVDNAYNSLTDT